MASWALGLSPELRATALPVAAAVSPSLLEVFLLFGIKLLLVLIALAAL